ncbi:hypothetical protein BJ875DRAFT_295653 [Amylocarpus encephaloides]|uniref:Uncharacterized protein n=1 Tax=Amylocarpus encephaloides TaxID=45428 RepID=A0A9P7YJH9_9HELO|nr:hypothetical protein BJ875DRAFT_295653 [Amylocarpus encephaloides]
MPPIQRTFSLIPTKVSNVVAKPPMTSKAAKKAYLKANRAPRVSRAEERRLNNEELERQKKEYEKERNAAKAKAAREKRAAKLAEDKEARRKMGLPEPSRFVRASQPTIATFVKAGTKRKLEEMDDVEEESEDTMGEEFVDPKPGQHQYHSKTRAAELESDDEFGDFPSLSQTNILAKIDSSMPLAAVEEVSSKPEGGNRITLDPGYGVFPSVPQSHVFDKLGIPKESVKQQKRISTPGRPIQDFSKGSPHQQMSPDLPKHKPAVLRDDDDLFDDSQALADIVTTQILSEAAEAEAKSSPAMNRRTTPNEILDSLAQPIKADYIVVRKAAAIPLPWKDVSSKCVANESQISPGPDRRTASIRPSLPNATSTKNLLGERSINMTPPTLSVRKLRAISYPPSPNKARLVPNTAPVRRFSMSPKEIAPPSATQAFIEDHLDDFFPSPSQQVRELLDDIDDFPSNTQVALHPSPKTPPVEGKPGFQDFFSSQDLMMSSQVFSEIITPCSPPVSRPNHRKAMAPLARVSRKPGNASYASGACDSQNSRSRPTAGQSNCLRNVLEKATMIPNTTLQPQTSYTRPPSTDETLMKDLGIIRPNQPCQQIQDLTKSNPMPPPVPPKIPLPRPPKRRFFEEKEEDLFHAAIEESRNLATAARQKHNPQLSGKRAAGFVSGCDVLNGPSRQTRRVSGNGSKDRPPIFSRGRPDFQRTPQTGANDGADHAGDRPSAGPKYDGTKFGKTRPNSWARANKSAADSETTTAAATRSKRTLQGSDSGISDYGDDEFIGCSQELLALC